MCDRILLASFVTITLLFKRSLCTSFVLLNGTICTRQLLNSSSRAFTFELDESSLARIEKVQNSIVITLNEKNEGGGGGNALILDSLIRKLLRNSALLDLM